MTAEVATITCKVWAKGQKEVLLSSASPFGQLSPILLRVYLRPKSWQRKWALFSAELKVRLKGDKGKINVRIAPSSPWPVPSLDMTGSKLTRFPMGLGLTLSFSTEQEKISICKLLFICKPHVVKPSCVHYKSPLIFPKRHNSRSPFLEEVRPVQLPTTSNV